MATALAALVTVLVASTTILHLAYRLPKSGPIPVDPAARSSPGVANSVTWSPGAAMWSHHGRDAGQVELLDDPQADGPQAANDHVSPPVRIPVRHPGTIQVLYDADVSGAYAA